MSGPIEDKADGVARYKERKRLRRVAIDKILSELDWRGPTGKKMGHVVLPRELAIALIGYDEKS